MTLDLTPNTLLRHGSLLTLALTALLLVPLPRVSADDKAKDRLQDLTFDDIQFEMEKGAPFERSMLTKKIEDLAGQRIRIRGYILPSFKQNGITQFVLVRDNMECCFGPGAALYDCIIVEMDEGRSTSYTIRSVAVEGVFTVKPYKGPDGKHLAIYHLVGYKVR